MLYSTEHATPCALCAHCCWYALQIAADPERHSTRVAEQTEAKANAEAQAAKVAKQGKGTLYQFFTPQQ